MIAVPTLVLPRDDELDVLGRTVEQTLGRSVESIDVIGRGEPCAFDSVPPMLIPVDPLSRASLYRVAMSGYLPAHESFTFS